MPPNAVVERATGRKGRLLALIPNQNSFSLLVLSTNVTGRYIFDKKKKKRSILIARPRNPVSLFRTDLVAIAEYNGTHRLQKKTLFIIDDPVDQRHVDAESYIHRNYRNWDVIRGTRECMYRVLRGARTCRRDEGHEIAIKPPDETIVCRCSDKPDGNYFCGETTDSCTTRRRKAERKILLAIRPIQRANCASRFARLTRASSEHGE